MNHWTEEPREGFDRITVAIDAIREGGMLHSPIADGALSTTLCHLGNYAQRYGRTLTLDPANGHILGDEEAMSHWSREYEDGWSPEF